VTVSELSTNCPIRARMGYYNINRKNSMADRIIDRDKLQDLYINEIIDGMDVKDLCALVYDYMDQNLESYSVNELIAEVEEYYPELLAESEAN
jgi:hypothetical protein